MKDNQTRTSEENNAGSSECEASGKDSTAHGISTCARATASHAEGVNTCVEDEPEYGKNAHGGHAEGAGTRVTGWQGHAEGSRCWAEGLIAHAQNCITLAAGNDSHSEGVQTVTGRRRYFIRPEDQGMDELPGKGPKPFFLVRADSVLCPDGDCTREFPERTLPIVHGKAISESRERESLWQRHNTAILFSQSEGPMLKVEILKSIHDPEMQLTKVFYDLEDEAFALPDRIMMACASYAPEGDDSTYNDGKGQHAEGKRTNAAANFAHAEGRDTTCFGRYSHVEGYLSKTTGWFGAHAEGHDTAASGHFSHSEGNATHASGNAAHAEGSDTLAAGDCSHTSGSRTRANGDSSFAVGRDTCAEHPGSFIMGRHGATDMPDAWHLAGGSADVPELRARIDRFAGHHAGAWASGGTSYAQCFKWADNNPAQEDRSGLFVTVRDDDLLVAEPDGDYVLGVVTATPGFVAGDSALGSAEACLPGQQARELADVAMVGRVIVRDNGSCAANAYCAVGPGGVAVSSDRGYRVLRRINENHVEIVLK